MKVFIVLVVLAAVSSQANSQSRNGNGCQCTQEYIPFCGTDGVTYPNRCSLDCARQTVRSLQVKFEGVCPEPYRAGGGGASQPQQPYTNVRPPPVIPVTRRPYYTQATYATGRTTQRPYYTQATYRTTQRPYYTTPYRTTVRPFPTTYRTTYRTERPYTQATYRTTARPYWAPGYQGYEV